MLATIKTVSFVQSSMTAEGQPAWSLPWENIVAIVPYRDERGGPGLMLATMKARVKLVDIEKCDPGFVDSMMRAWLGRCAQVLSPEQGKCRRKERRALKEAACGCNEHFKFEIVKETLRASPLKIVELLFGDLKVGEERKSPQLIASFAFANIGPITSDSGWHYTEGKSLIERRISVSLPDPFQTGSSKPRPCQLSLSILTLSSDQIVIRIEQRFEPKEQIQSLWCVSKHPDMDESAVDVTIELLKEKETSGQRRTRSYAEKRAVQFGRDMLVPLMETIRIQLGPKSEYEVKGRISPTGVFWNCIVIDSWNELEAEGQVIFVWAIFTILLAVRIYQII